MKVLVAYFSQTGKTKSVAEAIFESIGGEKELKKLDEVDSLEGYDLSFIGFPIIAFGPAKEGKEFLEQKAAGKKVALFITHAAPEDQEGVEAWLDKCREAASSAELVGFFHCQGELSEALSFANLAASLVCTRHGAEPPTMEELRAFTARYGLDN